MVLGTPTPMLDACMDRWDRSPLANAAPQRDMAWLCSFRQWSTWRQEMYNSYLEQSAIEQRFMGCPIYIGNTNPDPLPLFLPERTVRSMVGLWEPRYEGQHP